AHKGWTEPSSVDFAHIYVDGAEDGDEVGDLPAAGHQRQRPEVDERRAAPLHPLRVDGAVGLHVAADRTLGSLHLDVGLTPGRRLDALRLLAEVRGHLMEQVETLQD